MKINNWYIKREGNDPYIAPECRGSVLCGRLDNGKAIRTSAIIGKRGCDIVTRTGSVYSLGEPNADYEYQFPGVLDRVLKNLPEV